MVVMMVADQAYVRLNAALGIAVKIAVGIQGDGHAVFQRQSKKGMSVIGDNHVVSS